MKKTISTILILIFFVTGCASYTTIDSHPSKAKVYVDGNYVGDTPVDYGDKSIAGTTKSVTLKKDGYKDKNVKISKEEAQVGPIIGGFFVLVPFLWSLGYPDNYNFEMEPLEQ
ncbi:PEGA domain-containing protein [Zooshikella marina]|uniref:PEGA domain-containing protein n=1 Tax=Zooshikella ganghwensis TaxID=202772 RepID=UPI001BAEA6B5|nr:PEGA domain-containing protein [Zooshikella ganghwensis]MBU2709193.1 PEGA domain-containing protein [Zooshikella ganghwensis]